MDKSLTVIIPTYNMQDYLRRCLDSLIVRPDLLDSLEVLVINDGSKDNSSLIAHEYSDKYPNTFKVVDKENGHYGSCVNRGIAEAAGKYVKVLDADDWFDTSELEHMLENIKSIEVDVVLTGFNMVDESGNVIEKCIQNIPDGEIYDFNSYPPTDIFNYPMHMVAYRTEFLRNIEYKQTEGINYTDTEWQCCPQYAVNKFVYYQLIVYQYLRGREGQSMDDSVIAKNVWQLETVLIALVNNRGKYDISKSPLAESNNISQMLLLTKMIYKIVLIWRKKSKNDLLHLKQFDIYLKSINQDIWNKAGLLVLNKKIPIHYVRIWRRTGFVLPFYWIRKIYGEI